MRRAFLLCTNLLHCCCPRTWPACDHVAMQTSSEHFLHTSHCTLHTLHFTLHTCTSHSTAHLISNHLISFRLMSPHLTSSHLIPSLLTYHLSKFFSTIFMSSEHWKNHLNSSQLRCTLESSYRQSLHKVLLCHLLCAWFVLSSLTIHMQSCPDITSFPFSSCVDILLWILYMVNNTYHVWEIKRHSCGHEERTVLWKNWQV